jgi:hypothetical protein
MTSPQAILAGAALIAAAILFVNGVSPAQAQRTGPYQLMHHSNVQANTSVFRLDTSTGEVTYCFIGADGGLSCTKEK